MLAPVDTTLRARLTGYAALLFALGACQPLETIEAGVCGNLVHEPDLGEDCDGIPEEDGARCGTPDSAVACRLVCSATGEASAGVCPPGWGCGNDGVCRRPSADFDTESLPGLARGVGDLDGDGRSDVILRGSQDEIKVAFFTEARTLIEVFFDAARTPLGDAPAVLPVVANLTNDGIDDLALPVVRDDVAVRMFMGRSDRQLEDPFVELITVPFSENGDLEMLEVFNPRGFPQGQCEIGGCPESLLLSKRDGLEQRFAVLDDRSLVSLFTLVSGRRQQSWAVARWDQGLPCDLLAVSYIYSVLGSPGNRADLFSLCDGLGEYNISAQADPLGSMPALTSVSVEGLDDAVSLILAGSGDIDGDHNPDLLLNFTTNDPNLFDDGRTFALYGTGDGHFNARADFTGAVDLADASAPLILAHPWDLEPPEQPLEPGEDPKEELDHATWPQLVDDLNGDGRADMLLTAGILVISTPNPTDSCVLDGQPLISGPPLGLENEAQWGYSCVLLTSEGPVSAAEATFDEVVRNWDPPDAVTRSLDLEGNGRRAFAAIDKNKEEFTGAETDHSEIDYLDLFWFDPGSSQLIHEGLAAKRFEQVAAGDMDGDFTNELVFDDGESLQVIRGAPFDTSRASNFSPVGFDQLELFNEGLPSPSLGAERDGRLTVFRDGQWPALALLPPDACALPDDCHVRFATGDLPHPKFFAWALGVVRSTDDSGLRALRAIEGEANLGPAYDSTLMPLVALSEFGISAEADAVTVVALELGGEGGEGEQDLAPTTEALVIAATQTGIEIAVLRPHLRPADASAGASLCGPSFSVPIENNALEQQVVCFEHLDTLAIPGQTRPVTRTERDPFIEIGDANADGKLDLTWVTTNNSVMVLLGDDSGTLSTENLVELRFADKDEEDEGQGMPDPDERGQPARIDWVRWIELDGSSGPELFSGDLINKPVNLWGINVSIDQALLDPRGFLIYTDLGDQPGHVADFDGDGVDDLAAGSSILFGKPRNIE